MKAQNLKNYGRSISDIMLDPNTKKYSRQVLTLILSECRKELGIVGTGKLLWAIKRNTRSVKNSDWSRLREHGPLDQRFVEMLLEQDAAMKSLEKMIGTDKASEFYLRITERIGNEFPSPLFPPIEEFQACGNAFEAFREYLKAMGAADQKGGLHEIEVIEDTHNAFAYNVKYCVWNEIAREVGVSKLCYAFRCYGDEVYFNSAMPKIGVNYKRTGTLMLGAPICDVRFERVG